LFKVENMCNSLCIDLIQIIAVQSTSCTKIIQ